jgi:hypothetical protein
LDQKNKMKDQIKMADRHEFTIDQSIFMQSIEIWDFLKKNNVEEFFF